MKKPLVICLAANRKGIFYSKKQLFRYIKRKTTPKNLLAADGKLMAFADIKPIYNEHD